MEKLKDKLFYVFLGIVVLIIVVTGIYLLIPKNNNEAKQVSSNVEKKEETQQKEEISIKKEEAKNIKLKEKISEKDWEVAIKDVGFKQDIVPSNPNSYYTHYQVKDTNNTYFYLTVEAKNISSLGLKADSIAKTKMKYNNKYEYTTFSTIEESGGGTFTYTNITNIDPLTTRTVYYLVEVPKTIAEESNTSVSVEITVNNNTYQLNVR